MGHCSKKCISSSISNLHSLQIRSFNGIFWCLPFQFLKIVQICVLTECQKYAWTKLPDVCQYEGKKIPSWDKTAIFLSVWRQKKKPTKEQS